MLKSLQNQLGHTFQNPALLRQALTHRSFSATHYERLEFLGDGVLNFTVAHILYEQFAQQKEGDLSRIRAHLVRQETLVEIAQQLKITQCLFLGEGERKSGGATRPSILADVVEAIFGAIFCDAGFDAASAVIQKLYAPIVKNLDPNQAGKDAKTQLQERLQAAKIAVPKYEISQVSGAAHEQLFTVTCRIESLNISTTGSGATRRLAEQEAALLAAAQLDKLKSFKTISKK
ncbi:MAG: ribonuclease III [Formosimonas sp.]